MPVTSWYVGHRETVHLLASVTSGQGGMVNIVRQCICFPLNHGHGIISLGSNQF